MCQTPHYPHSTTLWAVKGSEMDKHHTQDPSCPAAVHIQHHAGYPRQTQPRSGGTFERCVSGQRSCPEVTAQSHSAKSPDFTQHDHGKVCLWNRTLPKCISPRSFLLSPFPRSRRQTKSVYSASGQQAQSQAGTCYCPNTKRAVNDWQPRSDITWAPCSSPVLPHWSEGQSEASTPETLLWCFSKITDKTGNFRSSFYTLYPHLCLLKAVPTPFKESTSF